IGLAQVPGAVPDVGLAVDLLESLTGEEAARVPGPIGPGGQEDEVGDRLTEVDAVIADQQPQVNTHVRGPPGGGPEPVESQQDVSAVPQARALMGAHARA